MDGSKKKERNFVWIWLPVRESRKNEAVRFMRIEERRKLWRRISRITGENGKRQQPGSGR